MNLTRYMRSIVFGGTIFFYACSGLQVAGQLHAGRNALQTGRPQDAWLATWSRADAAVPHPLDPGALAEAVAGLARRRVATR